MEFKKIIIKGTLWVTISRIVGQVLTFTSTVILARLLNPDDFGVVAISYVFINFAMLFSGLGLNSAIIQKKNIDDKYLSTSFWATFFTSILIALVLTLISPLIALFYKKDILKYIIILFSAQFIFSSLYSVHVTILEKKMIFKKVAIINILRQIFYVFIAIILAFLGFGVWSIVLGSLSSEILLIPVVWKLVKWSPKLTFDINCFKDLFGFSANILGFRFVNFFSRNADNLIIGKVLGTIELGYYSIAYNLMMKPLQYISWSIGKVLFPVFSEIQDNKERVRNAYLKVIRSISLITFPMMMGLLVVSKEFILTFYGNKWSPVIIPLKLLCILGAMQSIVTTLGTIYNSQGRPDILLRLGILNTTIFILSFLIGVRWGINGLILAYILSAIPLYYLNITIANKLIKLKMIAFFRALLPAILGSMFMVLVLLSFRYMSNNYFHFNIYYTLISSVLIGAVSYLFFIFNILNIPEVQEIKSYIISKFHISSQQI